MLFDRLIHVLPAGLASVLSQMRDGGSLSLPCWSHRLLLVVDAALMVKRQCHAKHEAGGGGARYLFADSSPQAGRDWLIIKSRFIVGSTLVDVFSMTCALVQDNVALLYVLFAALTVLFLALLLI